MVHKVAFVCNSFYIGPIIEKLALEFDKLPKQLDLRLCPDADVVSAIKMIEQIERLDLIVMDSELMPGNKAQIPDVAELCSQNEGKYSLHIRLALYFLKSALRMKSHSCTPVAVISNYPYSGVSFFPNIGSEFEKAGAKMYVHYQRHQETNGELACDLVNLAIGKK